MLGAGALGRPRGMVGGEGREEGSGWGACVYLKLKKKKKKKKVLFPTIFYQHSLKLFTFPFNMSRARRILASLDLMTLES